MSRQIFPGFASESPVYAYFRRLPLLETTRLVLRPLRMRDAEDLFLWTSDPEVARYVLWPAHTSVRETREYIRYIRRLYRSALPSSWGIVLKETGRVIGTVGFMFYSPENLSCEIGYSLSREYWNRGIMTEAVSRVLRSVFGDLPVIRVEAQHDVRNPASGRVLEKCGMKKEGVLRSRVINKGEPADVALWAVLKSDLLPS